MRALVAIASYGEKNLAFLRQLISTYQAMPMDVDIVVLSEAPKQLPSDVQVLVGLPSKNPWSLPFAHKTLFAERVDQYDLFIYSEDDIGVSKGNIESFLRATEILGDDEIAGFLRYEKGPTGEVWMPDAHSMFRWKPDSVFERAGHVFAEFTNEHAAFYVLTQAQLRRAIASGGFLRAPYEGKYDMLCAAATDPYTSCGFRKVVCISDLPNSMVHHMSDRYAGQMGLPLALLKEQLETLHEIRRGVHPATVLCEIESRVPRAAWSKDMYEKPRNEVLSMVPAEARTVLSIGCGWGATEAALQQRGATVTAVPLDSVIGAAAAKRGIKAVYGRLDECFAALRGETFDCVLITNLLHLQADPVCLFDQCAAFVGRNGTLVVESPNFQQLTTLVKAVVGDWQCRTLRSFSDSGVSPFAPAALAHSGTKAGLQVDEVRWYDHSLPKTFGLRTLPVRLGRLTANSWALRATRTLAS